MAAEISTTDKYPFFVGVCVFCLPLRQLPQDTDTHKQGILYSQERDKIVPVTEDTLVYQVIAYDYTAWQAAQEFANKFFDKPRKIEKYTKQETYMQGPQFVLENGVAIYEIRLKEAVHLVSVPTWEIYRLSERWHQSC